MKPRRHQKAVILLLAAVLCFEVGELVLRAAIALDISMVCRPGLFASYTSDDDYWKLTHAWHPRYKAAAPQMVHPLLGWSQAIVSSENPLGLQDDTWRRLQPDVHSRVLFYGDSFSKGAADAEHSVPRLLEKRIGTDVLDLGVGGYGLDQITLMFRQTHLLVSNPTIVVGVLTDDLDRSSLTVRTSQKPYFKIGTGGALVLSGTPIERDQARFFREHPPQMTSYAWRLIVRCLQKASILPRHDRLEEKAAINAGLIRSIVEDCRARQLKLMFVMFYGQEELGRTAWQETFVKTQCASLNIPCVDTKPALLEYAMRQGVPVTSLYDQADNHHNNLGNEIIAEVVAVALRRL